MIRDFFEKSTELIDECPLLIPDSASREKD
jgi:hypothetical protein